MYYASSNNIMKYKSNKVTPVLRYGEKITNLKVREGIIISDSNNVVEVNNNIIFRSTSAIQAVNKTKHFLFNGVYYDVEVFSTFNKIYLFVEDSIFYVERNGVVTMDCIVIEDTLFIVGGTINGFILQIKLNVSELVKECKGKETKLDTCTKFEEIYEQRYGKIHSNEKIKNVKELRLFELKETCAHDDAITDVIINNKKILSSFQDKTIKIHGIIELNYIDSLIGHSDYVYESNFMDESDQIISAGADGCIVWHFCDSWKSKETHGDMTCKFIYNAFVIYKEDEKIINEENAFKGEKKEANNNCTVKEWWNIQNS